MKILRVDTNVDLLPKPNESRIVQDDKLPPLELTTSALALIFKGDQLVLPQLISRDWDIPGGHIDPDETPGQAMVREVYEETRTRLSRYGMLGHQRLTIHAPKPKGYRYPHPVSYQVFYWGIVGELEPFIPNDEVAARGFFSPEQAQQVQWVQRFSELYAAAYKAVMAEDCVSP